MLRTLPLMVALCGGPAAAQTGATEPPQSTESESQADVAESLRELRQAVEQLLQQVRALEARVRQLESERAAEGVGTEFRPSSVRPLGRFYVDRHGIIWDAGGRAMGVWGVNGQEAVPADVR